jgi:hypothetical protein
MNETSGIRSNSQGVAKVVAAAGSAVAAIAEPWKKLAKDRADAKATVDGGNLSMAQQQAHFDNVSKLLQQSHDNDMAKMDKKAELKSKRLADIRGFAGPAKPGSKMTLQVGKVSLAQTSAMAEKAAVAPKSSKPASAGRSKPGRRGKK